MSRLVARVTMTLSTPASSAPATTAPVDNRVCTAPAFELSLSGRWHWRNRIARGEAPELPVSRMGMAHHGAWSRGVERVTSDFRLHGVTLYHQACSNRSVARCPTVARQWCLCPIRDQEAGAGGLPRAAGGHPLRPLSRSVLALPARPLNEGAAPCRGSTGPSSGGLCRWEVS